MHPLLPTEIVPTCESWRIPLPGCFADMLRAPDRRGSEALPEARVGKRSSENVSKRKLKPVEFSSRSVAWGGLISRGMQE